MGGIYGQVTWEGDNLAVAPLFADPAAGNYHLSTGSPCIDAGDPAYQPPPDETDLDQQSRVFNDRLDLGADEYYPFPDCNHNGVADEDDLSNGTSQDCNGNSTPDECEPADCNGNGVLDVCDVANGTSADCNSNGIPDECERDCNGNGIPDACDIVNGTSADQNGNGIPDECEYAPRRLYVDDDAPGDPGPGDPTISDPLEDGSAAHPFDAIQKAIGRAYSGDELVVLNGLYTGIGNKDITFGGRDIYLHSAMGPETCQIDCEHTGIGFRLRDYESTAARLEGFAIRNGRGDDYDAGAIYCSDASPVVHNCQISDSFSVYYSAVELRHSNAIISNCLITRSDGSVSGDGAIACADSSSPVIRDCVIASNVGTWSGGISCYSASNPMILNCTLIGNTAEYFTGGMSCHFSSPTVRNCILWDNQAPGRLQVYPSGPSWPSVDVSVIEGELPPVLSAGAHNIYSDPQLLHAAAGNYHLASSSPCIDAGDPNLPLPGDGTDIDGQARILEGRVDIGADEYVAGDCNNNGVPDPQDILHGFSADCNANGVPDECEFGGLTDCNQNGTVDLCDLFAGTSQDCNHNGLPDDCEPGGDQDCDGDGVSDLCEIFGGSPDVNANHVPDACEPVVILYVDDNGPHDPGSSDPSVSDPDEDGSLEHPYDAIQEALDAAPTGAHEIVTVQVADGVYVGAGNRDLSLGGKVLTLRSQNGPQSCVINGQQAGRGFYLHGTSETPASHLQGFTIRDCTGDYGGGIFCSQSSPRISDCIITHNSATNSFGMGGGVYYYDHRGYALQLVDCQVSANSARGGGGGVICEMDSVMTLRRCLITDNVCPPWGDQGGGIYGDMWSGITVQDCILARNNVHDSNSSPGLGAAIWSEGDMLVIDHCTITQNVSDVGGSSLYTTYYCRSDVRNSIIWGDSPANTEISFAHASPPTVAFCDVAGGLPPGVIDLGGNIALDPLFVNPGAGDYHLGLASPCVDGGDPAFVPQPGETDIDGEPRVYHGRVDMGADERQPEIRVGDLNCDGAIDVFDVDPFVAALSDPLGYAQQYPDCNVFNADCNGDAAVNFEDINAFIALLSGGGQRS